MAEISFYINLISILLCIWLIFRTYHQQNFIALTYWLVFIFLVVGQAIHISVALFDSYEVLYLFNSITASGHLAASICVLFIIIAVIIADKICPTNVWVPSEDVRLYAVNEKKKYWDMGKVAYYVMNWVTCLGLSVLLVMLVGGVNTWATSDRPVASGSTFLLLGLGLTTYPLLIKLASKVSSNINDKLLFLVSVLMILSVSRIIAILHVMIFIFTYLYPKRSESKIGKGQIWILIGAGIILFFMMFVYGSYRHVVSRIEADNLFDIYEYIVENPENSLLSLDLNYRVSIEGMSGFSGVMSEVIRQGSLNADFGLSILTGFFMLIPSYFREHLDDLSGYINSFYWYRNSIVPGGLEAFFVHFSVLGILFYPLIYFWFSYILHKKIVSADRMRLKHTNFKLLKWIVIATAGLFLIRGSTMFFVFFIVSELIILHISFLLFRLFYIIR